MKDHNNLTTHQCLQLFHLEIKDDISNVMMHEFSPNKKSVSALFF
jgi:hypothetical protein